MSKLHLELDARAFEPGERVSGTIRWDHSQKPADLLRLSLLWHTAGKGDEAAETVSQIEVRSPPPVGSDRFAFDLPAYPWSFSGKLVSLIWAVEASLEPKGDLEREEIVIAPGRTERLL